tara:strand:- start:149 stop:379 length:231 start_codon:yes stop_codon:yes gene_type:complete
MEIIEEELILGEHYFLRNGLKTGPLRYSDINTSYIYEADVPQEDGSVYVFQFKKNGKYLTDDINNRYDIIKKLDNE